MTAKWQQEATADELAEYERLGKIADAGADANKSRRRIRQTCYQRAFAKAKAGQGVG